MVSFATVTIAQLKLIKDRSSCREALQHFNCTSVATGRQAIADTKQCRLDSDADHVLATRFFGRFIENKVVWGHLDLSSYSHKDGLGTVSSNVNGFGVALTLQWLRLAAD